MIKHPIVTTAWLESNLDNEQLVLLDTSMVKVVGKVPIEYDQAIYIPNSKRFDLENDLCNLASSQNNAFPTPAQFTQATQKLGISPDSLVVLYDNQGIYSSPRAWWIFRAMGFNNVVVLDGGLPQWLLENRPTVSSLEKEIPDELSALGQLTGVYQPNLVCDSSYIVNNMTNKNFAIIDARSAARFCGTATEPRAGMRSGHIPSSLNLPFANILADHCMKNPAQLADIFASMIPNKQTEIIFTCGSGITACIIMLAASIAGYQHTVLYDGSWSDWGSDESLAIEVTLSE
ncbi:sulfurtransferase [Colwellia sp. KU-HH00111]